MHNGTGTMENSWAVSSQAVLAVKNLPANVIDSGNTDLIPGLGKFPGVGNGNKLQ